MSSRFLLIPLKDDNEAGPTKPHEGRTWIIVMETHKIRGEIDFLRIVFQKFSKKNQFHL